MITFLHHIAGLVAQYGVPALFISVTLESLGAPLPGESAILIASGAAAQGDLNIWTVVVTAFVAAVLGDNIGFILGHRLGRPAIARHGARFGATEANLARAEAAIARYGPLLVVVARFFVVLRQFNGIVAGTSGMRWPVFLAANIAGAALWVGCWATLAYRFGLSTDALPFLWHHLALVAAIVTPLLILTLVVLHLRSRKRKA